MYYITTITIQIKTLKQKLLITVNHFDFLLLIAFVNVFCIYTASIFNFARFPQVLQEIILPKSVASFEFVKGTAFN